MEFLKFLILIEHVYHAGWAFEIRTWIPFPQNGKASVFFTFRWRITEGTSRNPRMTFRNWTEFDRFQLSYFTFQSFRRLKTLHWINQVLKNGCGHNFFVPFLDSVRNCGQIQQQRPWHWGKNTAKDHFLTPCS